MVIFGTCLPAIALPARCLENLSRIATVLQTPFDVDLIAPTSAKTNVPVEKSLVAAKSVTAGVTAAITCRVSHIAALPVGPKGFPVSRPNLAQRCRCLFPVKATVTKFQTLKCGPDRTRATSRNRTERLVAPLCTTLGGSLSLAKFEYASVMVRFSLILSANDESGIRAFNFAFAKCC
jgi:hypothetical protein